MIKALIVDDEQHASDELLQLVNETGRFDVVACCANALDALRAIKRYRPELLFLDIEMPVLNGFELLAMIEEELMPHVIFVTAYDEFALKAFEEKTLDYLLKPVDPQRLQKTITKVQEAIGRGVIPDYETPPLKRIPCQVLNRVKLIEPSGIDHVCSTLSGVQVVTEEGCFSTELTLKTIEQRTLLRRCHKQYLCNPEQIVEITMRDNGCAKIRTTGGQQIPVSRRYLRQLKGQLEI